MEFSIWPSVKNIYLSEALIIFDSQGARIYIYMCVYVCVCVYCYYSITQSCLTLCDPMDCSTPGLPALQPSPGAHSNSCSLSRWCFPTISSSIVPFSSRLQSFSASESFPMSQLCASGGQSTGASASASVLPKSIQDWFPLGWTGLISSLSTLLSRVFSSTIVWKHR